VLQHLARFGFVAAQKGAHGGYQLARPAASISLADIVEAIDGPLAITACGRKDEQCDQYGSCTVRDPLWRVRDRILTVLQTTTLAEMGDGDGRVPVTVSKGGPGGSVPVEAA
jgi:Rrf2 family protein